MTQPPEPSAQTILLSEVRAGLNGVQTSVHKLERAVQGDPEAGTPSLRNAVRAVADELKNEAESLCDRVDKLERAASQNEAYLKGMTTVVKWLGGGTLAGLLALIAQLTGAFGGGK